MYFFIFDSCDLMRVGVVDPKNLTITSSSYPRIE